jgi:hypothetical protein
MAYIITTLVDGVPHAIHANSSDLKFELLALDSASTLSRIFSHPYRAGAYQVLSWILDHEPTLSCYELQVSDEARFQK